MSNSGVSLLASSAAVPVAALIYWAWREGRIRSKALLRGLAFGLAFWCVALATHGAAFWLLDGSTWEWTRPILAGLTGAIAGSIAAAVTGQLADQGGA